MTATAVVMISPEGFGPNPQTAASNAFQQPDIAPGDLQRARLEWQSVRDQLVAAGVTVHEFRGAVEPRLPDQCFPNNWFSTHPDGSLVLYPMLAENRRAERRADVIQTLQRRYAVSRVIDLSSAERRGEYLEGTGSVVIDYRNQVGYAALSARTDRAMALRLGAELDLDMVVFETGDPAARPYYHSNVIMSIADEFALWCPEALPDPVQRRHVAERLAAGGRQVIEISRAQVGQFAANLLALAGTPGPVIALSDAARKALNADQAARLADHGRLLSVAVPTLERLGGGSVRCLLAEVHLAPRQ